MCNGLAVYVFPFQRGAVFVPEGDRGAIRAVFPEVSGKRPPGPGAGGREAGAQAVSAGEPGAQRAQPGTTLSNPKTPIVILCVPP